MLALRSSCGAVIDLDVDRWRGQPAAVELAVLDTVPDPVLDVGCGPGRLAAAVAKQGRPALGIDPSPLAVVETRRRGASALRRSVFAPLPGEGRWGAALLIDGNAGIGGDPVALLERIGQLLRPGGHAVVELDAPGQTTGSLTVRLDVGGRQFGPPFVWARLGADAFHAVAAAAGLTPVGIESGDGRQFGRAIR